MALPAIAETSTANGDPWVQTLALAAQSVVSLEISTQRSFAGSGQGLSTATGFVVDAERGIILTNRHVVGAGPISASATFQNQERVDVWPLYRDPVHDFGFLRYDPTKLRHAAPAGLVLRPDKVSKGLAIRVVGSDGGEQLSILAGTIARLDRAAPRYGRYHYNDFNTFYLQAASSTSGGSSGSPVLDRDGEVVALNAGANRSTASSFFLPLARIEHALAHLQRGEPVARGTLDTLWSHQPFRTLRRLGLSEAMEAERRAAAPDNNGLLLAAQVLPGGVADGGLQEGDILLSVDGRAVADFVSLEALLDEGVGEVVELGLLRQGESLSVNFTVGDLHARQPRRLLEIGGAVLHDMGLQQSRGMNLPRRGVVLSDAGYVFSRAGMREGALITEIDGEPVDSLDAVLDKLERAANGDRWLLRYLLPGSETRPALASVDIDGRWFETRHCSRRDDAPRWACESLALRPAAPVLPFGAAGTVAANHRDPLLARFAAALVRVAFDVPHPIDNVYARHFKGTGLIVDAATGLVAVDRNTVPVGLGDAEITLFGRRSLPAEAVFVHPRHNLALLRFDPAALGEQALMAIELAHELADDVGELTLVGFRENGQAFAQPAGHPVPETLDFPRPRLPRFSQAPLDTWSLPAVTRSLGGALVDDAGRVQGLWTSFSFQRDKEIDEGEWLLPASIIAEALALYREQAPLRALDAELSYLPLAEARIRGLPDAWLDRLAASGQGNQRALQVRATTVGSDAAARLRAGDLLLAIDGTPVASLRDAEWLARGERLRLTLLRDRQLIELDVASSAMNTAGTARLLNWAGAYLQLPPRELAQQRGLAPQGVYVAAVAPGSPAQRDGLHRNRLIIAVDGQPVADLDQLLARLAQHSGDAIVRLTLLDISGRRRVIGVQPDAHFWPGFELRRGGNGWERLPLG